MGSAWLFCAAASGFHSWFLHKLAPGSHFLPPRKFGHRVGATGCRSSYLAWVCAKIGCKILKLWPWHSMPGRLILMCAMGHFGDCWSRDRHHILDADVPRFNHWYLQGRDNVANEEEEDPGELQPVRIGSIRLDASIIWLSARQLKMFLNICLLFN